jgi:hypothetical protein
VQDQVYITLELKVAWEKENDEAISSRVQEWLDEVRAFMSHACSWAALAP